ncbi:hypothetical protein P5673_029145, partial [Acropora cervicornis]
MNTFFASFISLPVPLNDHFTSWWNIFQLGQIVILFALPAVFGILLVVALASQVARFFYVVCHAFYRVFRLVCFNWFGSTSSDETRPILAQPASNNEFDLSNDDIANVSHGNGNEFDISNGDSDYVSHDNGDHCSGVSNLSGYTTDEINKAVLLTTCASSYHSTENNLLSDCNFIVIPWSGITSDGIKLVNTCPIDNWLMIFQSLAKSGRLNLHNLNQAGELINVALQLIDLNKFADAKILFVQNPDVVNGVIDCYGNEADYCIRVLLPFLATSLMSSCDQVACPSKTEMYKSHSISLGCDNNKASFHSSLSEWLHSQTTTCQRKFSSKPSSDTP